MALRIGGPVASPFLGSLLTWGSVRSPLVLHNVQLQYPPAFERTTYSRTFPDTTGEDYPKFFIWESGSLFSYYKAGGSSFLEPYYYIENHYIEPTDQYGSNFSIGMWPDTLLQQVDNLQFSELLGEEVTTDSGNFNITQDAHKITILGRYSQFIEGLSADESVGYAKVLTIGKLTPV
jgi:hypothetical protein